MPSKEKLVIATKCKLIVKRKFLVQQARQHKISKAQLVDAVLRFKHFHTYQPICNFRKKLPQHFESDEHAKTEFSKIERDRAALNKLKYVDLVIEYWAQYYSRQALDSEMERVSAEREQQERSQFESERQRHVASNPHKNSMRQQIRDVGAKSYGEVKALLPKLVKRHSKKTITQAISKVKRGRKNVAKAGFGNS